MRTGRMRYKIALEAPVETDDGYGGTTTAFVEQFTAWAAFTFQRQSADVEADRRVGTVPVEIRVRKTANSTTITPDWRVRDTRTGTTYALIGAVPSDDRAWVILSAEGGVAA